LNDTIEEGKSSLLSFVRILKEKNLTKGKISKNDIKKRFYIDI